METIINDSLESESISKPSYVKFFNSINGIIFVLLLVLFVAHQLTDTLNIKDLKMYSVQTWEVVILFVSLYFGFKLNTGFSKTINKVVIVIPSIIVLITTLSYLTFKFTEITPSRSEVTKGCLDLCLDDIPNSYPSIPCIGIERANSTWYNKSCIGLVIGRL